MVLRDLTDFMVKSLYWLYHRVYKVTEQHGDCLLEEVNSAHSAINSGAYPKAISVTYF